MRQLIAIFSRPVAKLKVAILASITVSISCAGPDQPAKQTTEFRCPRDGLCAYPVGNHSFSGAYRQAENELRFDGLFSPARSIIGAHQERWSFQLVDQFGAQFAYYPSGTPPQEWAQANLENLPNDVNTLMEHSKNREHMARLMASALQDVSPPAPHLQNPWNQFCQLMAKEFGSETGGGEKPRNAAKEDEEALMNNETNHPFCANNKEEEQGRPTQENRDTLQETGEKELDDCFRHEDLSQGENLIFPVHNQQKTIEKKFREFCFPQKAQALRTLQ